MTRVCSQELTHPPDGQPRPTFRFMPDATTPLGLVANRRNLEVAIEAAWAQHLLARRLSVDDLVTDAIASLA